MEVGLFCNKAMLANPFSPVFQLKMAGSERNKERPRVVGGTKRSRAARRAGSCVGRRPGKAARCCAAECTWRVKSARRGKNKGTGQYSA